VAPLAFFPTAFGKTKPLTAAIIGEHRAGFHLAQRFDSGFARATSNPALS